MPAECAAARQACYALPTRRRPLRPQTVCITLIQVLHLHLHLRFGRIQGARGLRNVEKLLLELKARAPEFEDSDRISRRCRRFAPPPAPVFSPPRRKAAA